MKIRPLLFVPFEISMPPPVGAGVPAKIVNDNACIPDKRGDLAFFAGKPAPTGSVSS